MSKENVEQLLEWAVSNGAYINDKLTFEQKKDHGISCVIKESLTAADATGLFKIPKDTLLTPESADEFAKNYMNEVIFDEKKGNVNAKLIFFIAKLKFDKSVDVNGVDIYSKYKPYIDYLPSTGKGTFNPYFWSMEEKDLLDGTDAHIFMKRNFLKELEEWKLIASQFDVNTHPQVKDELLEYEAFKMGPSGGVSVDYLLNLKEISWTSFTAYLWASCIISSRAFPYSLFDDGNSHRSKGFLLPIVDLLNNEDYGKSECRWSVEDDQFIFSTLDDSKRLQAGCELYNNYGEKSNVDFLLNYGFCLKGNDNDATTLTLQVDPSVIDGAVKYGVEVPRDATENAINFELKRNKELPSPLIHFFAYLVKLRSEKTGFTLRMKLEGLSQLKAIIKTKLKALKKVDVSFSQNVSQEHALTIKSYRKSQKDIFQQTLEQIEKEEKKLLTVFKPFSFKNALSKDTRFFNSFLLVFGTRTYNDLIEKGILDHAVLLWIMRIANREVYGTELLDKTIYPDFISEEFEKVKNTTTIDNDDIGEYLPLYESLFPALCQKIPAVFDKGIWTLNNMIYAGVVSDRLTYKRETNGEVFFIDPKKSR